MTLGCPLRSVPSSSLHYDVLRKTLPSCSPNEQQRTEKHPALNLEEKLIAKGPTEANTNRLGRCLLI